jgi:cytoskeleton protein RodZ
MSNSAELDINDEAKLVADTAPVLSSTSVGYMLAQAREEQGIELEKVAERLNLGSDVIRAIESGRKEGLPPRPFLQGHIRSYAKLVNLDLAVVLPLWEKENPAPTPEKIIPTDSDKRIRRMHRSNRRSTKRSKRKRAIWLAVVLLLLVIVGLGLLSSLDKNNNTLTRVITSVPTQQQTATATQGGSNLALPLKQAGN